VCDLETSRMRRAWTALGHSATVREESRQQKINNFKITYASITVGSRNHCHIYSIETFLLPTDAHNVKKHRVIKTF